MKKGTAPKIRIEEELANAKTVLKLIEEDENKNITAVHDVSGGGIAVALSEMCIASDKGCEVSLTSDTLDENRLLYSESHGRYMVTVKDEALDDILSEIQVPVSVIGEVKGNTLKINDNEFTVDELNNAYTGVIEKYMA